MRFVAIRNRVSTRPRVGGRSRGEAVPGSARFATPIVTPAGGRSLNLRHTVAGLIGISAVAAPGFASIPEPSAIFYGELTNSSGFPLPAGTAVRIMRGSQVLATYTISHASPAGYAPVLRVPMVNLSDGTTQPLNTAKVSDSVQL